jgi:drug/metabolite transporter (DMT)-like permease
MIAASFLFVLLWSSSFITAKIGLRHLSPLLFVAIRLVACAIVLTVLMLLLQQSWRPLAGWRWLHCAFAGALLNGIGFDGTAFWSADKAGGPDRARSIPYSLAHGDLRADASG